MSLIELLISKLENKPKYAKYKSHHWADYIELLCLINIDRVITQSDVLDRVRGREEDLGEGNVDDIEESNEAINTDYERAEYEDKWVIQVNDWYCLLEFRSSLYQEYYPFELINDTLSLKKKITINHKFYIYLLICSNLYLFSKEIQNLLAGCFEILGLTVFKNFLPNDADIKLFGKSQYNQGMYSKGTLWTKIQALANNLKETVHPYLKSDDYASTDTGDGGLDIVAWIPTGDELQSRLIYLGQCACTDDWVNKQDDSSYKTWSKTIVLTTYTNNIILVPFCYRKAEGNWFKIKDIRESYLIDRKRMIYHHRDDFAEFLTLPVIQIIDQLISAHEPTF